MRKLLLLNVFASEQIGARIKQAREEAGLRQEDLHDLIGLSLRQVQNLEAGVSKPYKHLNAIAEVTNRPFDWFLHGETKNEDRLETALAELGALRIQVEQILALLEAPSRPRRAKT